MQFVELEHIDIEILKYIFKKEPIHKDEILRKFPDKKFSTEFRIKNLAVVEYRESRFFAPEPIENSSYIYPIYKEIEDPERGQIYINTGKYETSELGKKLLQDVKIEDVKNTKEYFKNLIIELMRSVVCPLLVALVTAYLTTKYLK